MSGLVRRRRTRRRVDAGGFFERLLDVSNEPSVFLVTRTRRTMSFRSVIAPTHGVIASSRCRTNAPARCASASETVSQTRAFSTRYPLRARRRHLLRQSSSLFVPVPSPFVCFCSPRGRSSRLPSSVLAVVQRAVGCRHPPLANGPFFTAMSTNEVNMTPLEPPTPTEGASAVDGSSRRRRVRALESTRLSGRRGRAGLGLHSNILCVKVHYRGIYVLCHDARPGAGDATLRRGPRGRRCARCRRAGDGRR